MNKKAIPLLVIAGLMFIFYFITKTPGSSSTSNTVANPDNPDLVIYWGDGCPHCENVKKYISTSKVDQKIKIAWKEVYNDKSNQNEMLNLVDTKCPELKTSNGVGVPLAHAIADGACLTGDSPIISWLESKNK